VGGEWQQEVNSYTVSWLDSHGKKYESTVQATNSTQAERAVWGEEKKVPAYRENHPNRLISGNQ
jgi:hypothetical protein